ncbi:hypothetical protein [Novosphingopyxis iocasae]|uniref:hypothetical protein n=1 Tax=Novosphingopyxis iocasae TaxID=2762729 RepID=UPI0016519360|nr:hypothetical protein [Novosphingopyxis iocasae]
MSLLRALPLLLAVPMLGGCLSTVADVVTLPVKIAKTGVNAVGSGIDAVTVSQSERDEKRGRDLRRREERLGKLSRERDKLQRKCDRDPGNDACADLYKVEREMEYLMNEPV